MLQIAPSLVFRRGTTYPSRGIVWCRGLHIEAFSESVTIYSTDFDCLNQLKIPFQIKGICSGALLHEKNDSRLIFFLQPENKNYLIPCDYKIQARKLRIRERNPKSFVPGSAIINYCGLQACSFFGNLVFLDQNTSLILDGLTTQHKLAIFRDQFIGFHAGVLLRWTKEGESLPGVRLLDSNQASLLCSSPYGAYVFREDTWRVYALAPNNEKRSSGNHLPKNVEDP